MSGKEQASVSYYMELSTHPRYHVPLYSSPMMISLVHDTTRQCKSVQTVSLLRWPKTCIVSSFCYWQLVWYIVGREGEVYNIYGVEMQVSHVSHIITAAAQQLLHVFL